MTIPTSFIAAASALALPLTLAADSNTYLICASCHGTDGLGMKLNSKWLAPSLHTSKYVTGDQAELLTALILKGIAKDDGRYSQPMMPLELILSDEQVAEIVRYTTETFGGQLRDVSADDVAEWREEYQDQTLPWHRSELAAKLTPEILSQLHFTVYHAEKDAAGIKKSNHPLRSGGIASNQLSSAPLANLTGDAVVVYEGILNLAQADDYEFRLDAGPGSVLKIDNEIVGQLASAEETSSLRVRKAYDAGSYRFELQFVASEEAGSPELTLRTRKTRKSFTLHETSSP
ncbi:MAG: c-type cytochrome [Verrucomicrobiota bacterium]